MTTPVVTNDRPVNNPIHAWDETRMAPPPQPKLSLLPSPPWEHDIPPLAPSRCKKIS